MSIDQLSDSLMGERPDIEWFEIAKAHMNPNITGIYRVAIGHATFTVASTGSDRVQAADAIATIEAGQIGAEAGILVVLEHLATFNENCEKCSELDDEIQKLLVTARAAVEARR